MTTHPIPRRDFIRAGALASAGLLLGVRTGEGHDAVVASNAADGFAFTPYIRIGTDDSITLFGDEVEMGQGVLTALPMILADELDVDWAKVRVERLQDDPASWPRGVYTYGSNSIRSSWTPLRRVGAAAREMLVTAAATNWNVDRNQLRTEKGFVIHDATNRRASYGALAPAAAQVTPPQMPRTKLTSEYRIIGTPVQRVDLASKADGSAQFGLDVRVPGMLVASVVRPPAFGGSVKRFDATAARAVPGVKDVIQFEHGIAILATDTWSALKGRRALDVEWAGNPDASLPATTEAIRRRFTELADAPGAAVARNVGDVESALRGAANPIIVTYELPFAAHATMEPLNCTVHVRSDGCEVWASTQVPNTVQATVARIAAVPVHAVKVHVMMAGGGFGRRARLDPVEDAALLSKRTGTPVKVMWMREDDMQQDSYRPFGIHRLRGAIGPDGMPIAWSHRVVTQPALGAVPRGEQTVNGDAVGGAADLPYAIPNLRVENIITDSVVPVGTWRSVGHSQNGFVTEGFLDELAAAGKKDPVELRRTLLPKSSRHRAVMELAVEKSGWGSPMRAGTGRGIAVHSDTGSYVAQVAEVTIDGKDIKVNRVVCAVDCGIVINPDTVAAQMEGSIIYGLTCALKNEITIANGAVEQANFNTYPMLRFGESPRIEVYIVPSAMPPGGIGEPGVPPIAAAVANAVYMATGGKQRLRKLPFRLS